MDIYLDMNIPERQQTMPHGFRHWDKEDPRLYIEWGFLLFISWIKQIIGMKDYTGKHAKEEHPWIVRKVDDVSIAAGLLVSTTSVLVPHLMSVGKKKLREIKLYATKLYLKSAIWILERLLPVKDRIVRKTREIKRFAKTRMSTLSCSIRRML